MKLFSSKLTFLMFLLSHSLLASDQIATFKCNFQTGVTVSSGEVTQGDFLHLNFKIDVDLKNKKVDQYCDSDVVSDGIKSICPVDGDPRDFKLNSTTPFKGDETFLLYKKTMGRGAYAREICEYVTPLPEKLFFEGRVMDHTIIQMRLFLDSDYNQKTKKCEYIVKSYLAFGEDEFIDFVYYLPGLKNNGCILESVR